MGVIGFNFRSIEARTEDKKIEGNVDVNSTPTIENVTKKDISIEGMKDVLSFEFSFRTKYNPDIGEINITGEVLYKTDDAKKILAMWKEKKMNAKITADVLNVVFRKCLTKAIAIADELRLPVPLNFPVVTQEKNKTAQGS